MVMKLIANYAVWQGQQFNYMEKQISYNEKTIVRVIACGFCGSDKHTLEELNVPGASLGHEILAEVVHLGNNHKVVGGEKLSIGDRVILIPGKNCGECCHCLTHTGQANLCQHRTAHGWGLFSPNNFFAAGGFSTHIELMDDAWLVRVPESISNDVAVLAEPLAIAIRAVDRALSGTRADRDLGAVVAARAAIIGVGPIGYLIAYVLNTLGVDVVGFDISSWRCDFFSEHLGMPSVHMPIEDADKVDQYIAKYSPIQEFDLVFECGGTTSAFVASLIAVRKAGRVIELGNYIQHDLAEIDPSWICRKELDLIGFVLANPYTYKKVFDLLKRNSLEPLKMITNKINLSEIGKILAIDHPHEMKVIVQNDL
jgi:L-iditol 2-dehydrogenase